MDLQVCGCVVTSPPRLVPGAKSRAPLHPATTSQPQDSSLHPQPRAWSPAPLLVRSPRLCPPKPPGSRHRSKQLLLAAPCAPVSPAAASLSLRVALFLLLSPLCRLCLSVRAGPPPPPWMAVPRARAPLAAAVARNRGRTTRSARSVRFPPTPSPGPPAVVFSIAMLLLLLLFLQKREQRRLARFSPER